MSHEGAPRKHKSKAEVQRTILSGSDRERREMASHGGRVAAENRRARKAQQERSNQIARELAEVNEEGQPFQISDEGDILPPNPTLPDPGAESK